VAVLVVLAGAAGWAYVEMRGSLAQLDGEAAMPGATGEIVIERDALGIPTISASSRADVARGLGFVHAQDRFFQMDLARRRAAGELSELFGSAALKIDTRTRMLRLRARARQVVELAPPEELALLRAYVEGVNAGLTALAVKPPEYSLALRMEPRLWTVEDSVLVVASMFLTLQDSEAQRESRLAAVYEALPPPLADFVTSTASEWETPLAGGPHRIPPIPGASVPTCAPVCPRNTSRPRQMRARATRRSSPGSRRLCPLSPRRTMPAGATIGPWPVVSPPTAAPSSRTTCTWACRRRTSGIARRWSGVTPGRDASPA
jgi:penicillin amidase